MEYFKTTHTFFNLENETYYNLNHLMDKAKTQSTQQGDNEMHGPVINHAGAHVAEWGLSKVGFFVINNFVIEFCQNKIRPWGFNRLATGRRSNFAYFDGMLKRIIKDSKNPATPTTKATFLDDLKSGKFANMVSETIKGGMFNNSQEVFNTIRPLVEAHLTVEKMYCIFLDAKNNTLALEPIFSGSLSSSAVYPRGIIKRAFEIGAAAIVMVHNHPSGDPAPSGEDITITKKMLFALIATDMTLHDHIIVGNTSYYSFNDNGNFAPWITEAKKMLNP